MKLQSASMQTVFFLTTVSNKRDKKIIFTAAIIVIFHVSIAICDADRITTNNHHQSYGASTFDIENSVGYGEDCSIEGPFCDIRQHLSCDNVEEICVCDDKNGYVHVGNLEVIPKLFEDDDDTPQKKICMKSSDLEHKMNRLMNITKKIKDFTNIMRKYQKYLPKKYQNLLKDEL